MRQRGLKLAPACGVKRVMSPIFPVIVGSDASVSRDSAVAAPVRVELKTVSDCAVTVTVSVIAICRTVRARSVLTPRLIITSSRLSGANAAAPVPENATVTE